jgi:putative ABC transport system ATP-binding protein
MQKQMVTIHDLHFSWSASDFRLHVPQLDVATGTAVAVTGSSGAGKTTLLNIIAGILPATSGTVTVGDTNLTGLSEARRRAFRLKQIGLIFQSFELIDYLNVLDNILLPARISPAMPLTPELRSRAQELLADVGLERYVARSVTRLSQGERQRVAICRSLLSRPSLLLADEPTGNLDPESTQRILDILLNQVRQSGTTLLMVSHDHTLLPQFDSVVDFHNLLSSDTAIAGGSSAS